MRFMMMVKGSEEIEKGVLLDAKTFAEIAAYNNELDKAGMLISLDGFHPSKDGARVIFSKGETSVTEGPFPNPEELVEGYWVIEASSKEEAITWAKKVPFKDGVIEIRQIQEISDFPPEIQKAAGGDRA